MATGSVRTDLVVFVPGLWMPACVMLPLALRLAGLGIRSLRFGYPSKNGSLEQNADRLAACIRGFGDGPVHLVGHSLGGVLALHATASRRLARVRSIVMMGSPAQDCYAARRLSERAWSRRLLGRSTAEWLAAPRPIVPEGVAVGVIAGTRPFGLGMVFVPDLPRPHDGVIRTVETAVSGARDRVELPVAHAGLLTSGRVAALVASFIRRGHFGIRSDAVEATAPALENGKGRSE